MRISPQPQYKCEPKGDDSDDTLCSDKEDTITSPRWVEVVYGILREGNAGNSSYILCFGKWNSFLPWLGK